MTTTFVQPQMFVSGKLRGNITDPNTTARATAGLSSNWIYPDTPRLLAIIKNSNNFPRISVTKMAVESKGDLGIGATETDDSVSLLINVFCLKDVLHTIRTTSGESHTFVSGTDVYTLAELPATSISSVTGTLSSAAHAFVKDTDYTLVDDDGDGRFDAISWAGSGDDPDNGTDFSLTYIRQLEGADLAEYLAQVAHSYLRDNWRTELNPTLFNYQLVRAPYPIDEFDGRIKRCEMQIRFDGVNIGN